MKKLFLPLIFLVLISCSSKESIKENEILWDTWGIPHIYATDHSKLYKMMGWSQMRNHANLILRLYGEARAKSSEYWGEDPQRDQLLHQLGLIDAAKMTFDHMASAEREIVESFAEGINAYAEKYPDQIEERYKLVLPVEPLDVIYHSTRVLYLEFLIRGNLQEAYQWSPGSNAWAINGSNTLSGNSMLLANPHLLWDSFFLFFEAHLITDDNSLYGATLVGMPTIGIGFNRNLGWTHTVNTLDNVDLYELTIDNNQYLIDGEYKDFEVDTITITVKADTTSSPQEIVKKRSDFGMIIKESGNKAIAISWPNMDGKMNPLGQWRAMGEAKNLDDFKTALNRNELPLFNVIYSDKEDNILYHFSGHIPKKNGDWQKWRSILPATSSEELWDGYYSTSELPGYINPKSGWIQNTNDPPFTSTMPPALVPDQFASHITPNYMGFRSQRSARLIMEAKNLTLDEFISLKHDTRSELALRIKDDLESLKGSTQDSLTLAALNVLSDWDGSFNSRSQGAVLFMNLIGKIGTSGYFEKVWSFEDPINTPDGLKNTEQMLEVIKNVAQGQIDQLGTLNPQYGDYFRFKKGEIEYAGNGGPGHLGIFRTLYYIPGEEGKFYPYMGDSYVCAIEFGETVKAKALLSYGNATQDGNPHFGDQLKLLSEKQLRDVWYTREQQESNLELIEKLSDM
ncbi:penicillin acylase family protein [Candidatus Latescibacterota bacterium]